MDGASRGLSAAMPWRASSITCVNIVGGIVIGMMRKMAGRSPIALKSLRKLPTIGDGTGDAGSGIHHTQLGAPPALLDHPEHGQDRLGRRIHPAIDQLNEHALVIAVGIPGHPLVLPGCRPYPDVAAGQLLPGGIAWTATQNDRRVAADVTKQDKASPQGGRRQEARKNRIPAGGGCHGVGSRLWIGATCGYCQGWRSAGAHQA